MNKIIRICIAIGIVSNLAIGIVWFTIADEPPSCRPPCAEITPTPYEPPHITPHPHPYPGPGEEWK